MTPMDTTASKATGEGTPPMSTGMRAGAVMTREKTATRITPATGTRLALSLDQTLAAGTAPSRLKAKSMRVQLVMQAMVQKSWPMVAISRTVPPQRCVRAWGKISATPPPPAVTLAGSCTAKRKARRRR